MECVERRTRRNGSARPTGGTTALVEELEFIGGPLAGRRLTAPEGIRCLHFYGFDREGRPTVATTRVRGVPLGSYRHHGAYDCRRTLEYVIVLGWVAGGDGAARAPATRANRGAPRRGRS